MARSPYSSIAVFVVAASSVASSAPAADLACSAVIEVDYELAAGLGSGLDAPAGERRIRLVGPDGTVEQFLAGEVLLLAAETEHLDAFLEHYAAEVMVTPELPPPPPDHPAAPREPITVPRYRISVDPRYTKLPDVDDLATEAGWRGEFRVSSDEGLELLSLLFDARRNGYAVAPNFLMTPQVSEEHPHHGSHLDADTPCTALTPPGTPWCTEHTGAVATIMRTGAARTYVEMTAPAHRPFIAIVDRGFAVEPVPGTLGHARPAFGIDDLPPSSPMYDFRDEDYDASGSGCLSLGESGLDPASFSEELERARLRCWHGTASALVAAAAGANRYGTVGTGAPVARTMLFAVDMDFASWARAIETAVHWGADVVNTSLAMDCGFCCDHFDAAEFYSVVHAAPIVASAGNAESDNDHADVLPCELDFAICVGGLSLSAFTAARIPDWGASGGSNYGENVDLWAKGDVLVAPLPIPDGSGGFMANRDIDIGALDRFGGTSASAPYVAGVIALMKAIDPSLTLLQIEDTFQRTANRSSSDWRVNEGWGALDAFAAAFDVARGRRSGRLVEPEAGRNYWSPQTVPLAVELCTGCSADSVRYYARFDAGDGQGVRDHQIAYRGVSGGPLRTSSRFFDTDWDVSSVPPQSDVPVWAILSGPTTPIQNASGHFIFGQAGRTEPRLIDVRIDSVAPTGRIVEPLADSRHRDTLPLRAEVEDDHELGTVAFTVRLEGGGLLATVAADATTGFATSTDISALPEQRLTIGARVYDAQDNYRDLEPVFAFVDRSGPQVQVVYPSPVAATPTWITSTGSTQIRVQATDPAGIATVELSAWYRNASGQYAQHSVGSDTTPNALGEYTVTWPVSAIPDQVVRGSRTQAGHAPLVEAHAIDIVGNESWSTGFVLGFDRLAPAVAILQPTNAASRSGGQLAIAVSASDATSGVVGLTVSAHLRTSAGAAPQMVLLGSTTAATWSGTLDLDPLPDQTLQVIVEATDEAGNVGSRQHSVVLDRTPPTLDWCRIADDPFYAGGGRSTSFSFQLVAPAASVVLRILAANGASMRELTATSVSTFAQVLSWDGRDRSAQLLSSGAYQAELTASDGSGNTATYPCTTFAVVQDTTPPVPKLTVASSFPLQQGRLDILFSIDEEAYVELEILDAAGAVVRFLGSQQMAAGDGALPWDGADFSGLPVATPATYTVRLRATDLAGNSSSTSAAVAVTR